MLCRSSRSHFGYLAPAASQSTWVLQTAFSILAEASRTDTLGVCKMGWRGYSHSSDRTTSLVDLFPTPGVYQQPPSLPNQNQLVSILGLSNDMTQSLCKGNAEYIATLSVPD